MTEVRATEAPPATGPVLIAYDGSACADRAIQAAAALLPDRPALVVTVWRSVRRAAAAGRVALPDDIIQGGVAALDAEAHDEAKRLSEAGARLALERGLRAEAETAVCERSTTATVTALAYARNAAVVVVGSRGRSAVRSTFLGGVTYGLLHATQHPVLVVRDDAAADARAFEGPVMLCYDGSASARHATEVAGGLLGGSRGVVVHAWEAVEDRLVHTAAHPPLAPQHRDVAAKLDAADRAEAETVAAEGADVARGAGFEATSRIVTDRPGTWECLSGVAEEENARLVVVGSRGRSSLASLVIGSVSHGLLHHSARALLIVPPQ